MTLDEVQRRLDSAAPFGSDIDADERTMLAACHPDLHDGSAEAAKLFKRVQAAAESARLPPVVLKGKRHTYTLGRRLASGDVADIYLSDQYIGNAPRLLDKIELLRQRYMVELAEYDCRDIRLFSSAEWMSRLPAIRMGHEAVRCNDVVFEGAQGVLLDENYGFHPHTTWSDVTMRHALEVAQLLGVDSIESKIGCVRPYMTRHGSGPLPTEFGFTLADAGNPHNRWQGSMRFGTLDMPLLRYSEAVLRHSGQPLTGLSISCLDHIADGYSACLAYHRELPSDGSRIQDFSYTPTEIVPLLSADDAVELLSEIAPAAIVGTGPTHLDRKAHSRSPPPSVSATSATG